jgi:hypothetical protein
VDKDTRGVLRNNSEECRRLCYIRERVDTDTGWGKITSLNFKVNNKKTNRYMKILFLDSETTTWEVLNHSFKKNIFQVVAVTVQVQSTWETAKRTI